MVYSLTFLSVAVAFGVIAAAVPVWPVRLAAGWVSGTFVVVAIAYAVNTAGLLGKRRSGGRWPWAWLLAGPYLLLTEVSYRISRKTMPESGVVPLAENLFLGRRLLPAEAAAAVTEHRFHAVLDLAAEFAAPRPFRNLAYYNSVPILDAAAPSAEQLHGTATWLLERIQSGPVFVHCALGHGRSALAVAAYFVASGIARDPKSAVAMVKAVRPKAKLTDPQWAELKSFANSLSRR
ncbi:MAG TPA: dual specificity protein phosphatase family protein [Fimbriiglobus sp.]